MSNETIIRDDEDHFYGSIKMKLEVRTNEDRMAFMNENQCTFDKHRADHTIDVGVHTLWSLFTIRSQWVHGDSVEECLDIAMCKREQCTGWWHDSGYQIQKYERWESK